MIKKDELHRIAVGKNLSPENAEKDYFLELILYSIYSQFSDIFILKGGTALYKFYNLNRFSEDLDFVLNRKKVDLTKILRKVLKSVSLVGIEGRIKNVEKYKNEINVKLNFKGPLYNGRKESLAFIALNISQREKPMQIKKELLIPSYKEIPSFEVFVMGMQEILSEKVRAILTRNKARDIYDCWFLLKRGVKPETGLINKKLKIYKLNFSRNEFIRQIEEKKGFWKTDLSGLIIGKLPSFDEISKEIKISFHG